MLYKSFSTTRLIISLCLSLYTRSLFLEKSDLPLTQIQIRALYGRVQETIRVCPKGNVFSTPTVAPMFVASGDRSLRAQYQTWRTLESGPLGGPWTLAWPASLSRQHGKLSGSTSLDFASHRTIQMPTYIQFQCISSTR